jgi:hypothetical protein
MPPKVAKCGGSPLICVLVFVTLLPEDMLEKGAVLKKRFLKSG